MRVGVLGTGNMGKAIINGLSNCLDNPFSVIAYDKNKAAYTGLPSGVQTAELSEWVKIGLPEVIIMAVKPDEIKNVINSFGALKEQLSDVLWISIAAGIGIPFLENCLGSKNKICRVMPNTPALIGEGMCAYTLNSNCTESDRTVVETVLSVCGKIVAVPEKMMNAVTGLSGSGPAYVFQFIEALIEGGITAGLSSDIAKKLAVQTVIGAAKMLDQTGEAPSVLKTRVMSPAGTTARGLLALEKSGFKYGVINAVLDATKRSEELGA